jgi:hypothetical protein
MQSCASAAKAPRRRADSAQRHESHGFRGTPPPRTVIGDPSPWCGSSRNRQAIGDVYSIARVHRAGRMATPSGTTSSRAVAAFPFAYIRCDEFLDAVQTLASDGTCSFRPFDWSTFGISEDKRTVNLSNSVIIEGVSSLNPSLCSLYGLKIFIESDRATTLQAALDRGGRRLGRPLAQIVLAKRRYLHGDPASRACGSVDRGTRR